MSTRTIVKSIDHQVKECVRKISDEDQRWLFGKLRDRIGSDLADALVFIENHYPDLNRILSSTANATAVYEICDSIEKSIQEEFKKKVRPKN